MKVITVRYDNLTDEQEFELMEKIADLVKDAGGAFYGAFTVADDDNDTVNIVEDRENDTP